MVVADENDTTVSGNVGSPAAAYESPTTRSMSRQVMACQLFAHGVQGPPAPNGYDSDPEFDLRSVPTNRSLWQFQELTIANALPGAALVPSRYMAEPPTVAEYSLSALSDDLDMDPNVACKMLSPACRSLVASNSNECAYFHFARFLAQCRDAQVWIGGIDGARNAHTYYRGINKTFLTRDELYMLHRLQYLFRTI